MAKKEKDKHDRRDAELQASSAVAGQEAGAGPAPADRIPAVGNWVPGNVGGNPLTAARRCWGGVRAARPGRLLDGRREAGADCGREP